MGDTQQTNMEVKKEQVNALIEQGQKRGLTGKDVIDALVRKGFEPEGVDVNAIKQSFVSKPTQITQQTPTKEPGVFERIKTGIQEKGKGVTESITDDSKSTLSKITGAGAEATSAISTTVYNTLPEPARSVLDKIAGGVGKGFEILTDKLANSKLFQEAAMSGETGKLEEALKIASDLGVISGELSGAKVATKTIEGGVNLAKKGIKKVGDISKRTVADLVTTPEELAQYPTSIADAISEKLTVIEPKVKNILNTTSIEKFDNYVKAGEEAIKNPRALTPLEQAGDVVKNKVLPTIQNDLKNIGKQKAKSLMSVGATQVKDATLDVIDYIKNTTKGLKLTLDEKKLIKQAISDLEVGKTPTLSTLDKTVDLLQSTLFEKSKGLAIPATSRVKSIINQSINKLNTTVKTAAKNALKSDEYSILNEAYATKKNLFNNINKLLGEEGKKGGSIIKRFFSPQDSGIKKVFSKVKDLYGIDLAEDATLAKFIMDSLGDTRAASLLETVPLTKSGVATKAINYAYSKLQQPIKKARKIIVESQAQ